MVSEHVYRSSVTALAEGMDGLLVQLAEHHPYPTAKRLAHPISLCSMGDPLTPSSIFVVAILLMYISTGNISKRQETTLVWLFLLPWFNNEFAITPFDFWCTLSLWVTPQPLYIIEWLSLCITWRALSWCINNTLFFALLLVLTLILLGIHHFWPYGWALGDLLSPLVNCKSWDIKIMINKYFNMHHTNFGAYRLRVKEEIGNTCLSNEKNLDSSTATIARVKDTLSATSKSALAMIKWCSSMSVD